MAAAVGLTSIEQNPLIASKQNQKATERQDLRIPSQIPNQSVPSQTPSMGGNAFTGNGYSNLAASQGPSLITNQGPSLITNQRSSLAANQGSSLGASQAYVLPSVPASLPLWTGFNESWSNQILPPHDLGLQSISNQPDTISNFGFDAAGLLGMQNAMTPNLFLQPNTTTAQQSLQDNLLLNEGEFSRWWTWACLVK